MLAFIDTEVTGFSRIKHDVIELACIITDNDYDVKGIFNERSQPGTKHWTAGAEKIHGITRESLRDAPSPSAFTDMFDRFVTSTKGTCSEPLQFISHDKNRFDYKWVEQLYYFYFTKEYQFGFNRHFSHKRAVSTIDLAKSSRYTYSNYKLGTLADYHDIELDSHVALSDARACLELYKIYNNDI